MHVLSLVRVTGITLLQFALRKELPSWKQLIWRKPRISTQEYVLSSFCKLNFFFPLMHATYFSSFCIEFA